MLKLLIRYGLPTRKVAQGTARAKYDRMAADADFRALHAAQEVAAAQRWGPGYLRKWVPTFTSAAVRDITSPLRKWVDWVRRVDARPV
jgi:hypothetical protein